MKIIRLRIVPILFLDEYLEQPLLLEFQYLDAQRNRFHLSQRQSMLLLDEKILVRFNLKSGSEPGFARYDLQGLRSDNDLWESNDEGVDLIVFRTLVYDAVKFKMFPIELIASKETFSKENINVSDRVVIPCLMENYPRGLSELSNFSGWYNCPHYGGTYLLYLAARYPSHQDIPNAGFHKLNTERGI